jgi:hypothetical protein
LSEVSCDALVMLQSSEIADNIKSEQFVLVVKSVTQNIVILNVFPDGRSYNLFIIRLVCNLCISESVVTEVKNEQFVSKILVSVLQ